MKTFEELYCSAHECTPDRFRRALFWKSLPWHAVLVAPFLGGIRGDYFAADRELIASVSRAVDMVKIKEEIRDYFLDAQNRGWWRHGARIRISTVRLKNTARRYLPASGTAEPFSAGSAESISP